MGAACARARARVRVKPRAQTVLIPWGAGVLRRRRKRRTHKPTSDPEFRGRWLDSSTRSYHRPKYRDRRASEEGLRDLHLEAGWGREWARLTVGRRFGESCLVDSVDADSGEESGILMCARLLGEDCVTKSLDLESHCEGRHFQLFSFRLTISYRI